MASPEGKGNARGTFEEITGRLREGITEKELALDIETTMRRLGADAVAFDSIVAFGESAAEPHHGPGDRALLFACKEPRTRAAETSLTWMAT